MNNVVRYEDLMKQFHSDVNRLFNAWGSDLSQEDRSRIATSAWAPAVDITEESDRFVLHADIPGVEPKDIEITMENGLLTIKGDRVREQTLESNGVRRTERAFGTFHRRFSLPDSADAEHISAKGENGVLEVSIPKKERAQPRRITVG